MKLEIIYLFGKVRRTWTALDNTRNDNMMSHSIGLDYFVGSEILWSTLCRFVRRILHVYHSTLSYSNSSQQLSHNGYSISSIASIDHAIVFISEYNYDLWLTCMLVRLTMCPFDSIWFQNNTDTWKLENSCGKRGLRLTL